MLDRFATAALSSATRAVILLLLFISYIFYKGSSTISWHFLTGSPSASAAGGGVGPLLFNSFYILILTLFFSVPIAVCARIYLQEYAGPSTFREASIGRSAYDFSPFHTAETLAVGLYQTHREALVPDADAIGNGSALVVLVMVVVFNIVARIVGRRLTLRLTGKV